MAILMFHVRGLLPVPAAKLNMRRTLVGPLSEDGTSRYTIQYEIKWLRYPSRYEIQSCLLCCPLLSPQIIGAVLVDPLIWKVSVQVPAVGCEVVNEIKSNLRKEKELYESFLFLNLSILNAYRSWQIGFFCSTNVASSLTVNVHVEGALRTAGDCQCVLLRLAVPPHDGTTSIFKSNVQKEKCFYC